MSEDPVKFAVPLRDLKAILCSICDAADRLDYVGVNALSASAALLDSFIEPTRTSSMLLNFLNSMDKRENPLLKVEDHNE